MSHWKIVGSAVTMNLPDSPGLEVTSTWPTPISRSSVQPEKSSQMGCRARQAGHHGAMLIWRLGCNEVKQEYCQYIDENEAILTTQPSILPRECPSSCPLWLWSIWIPPESSLSELSPEISQVLSFCARMCFRLGDIPKQVAVLVLPYFCLFCAVFLALQILLVCQIYPPSPSLWLVAHRGCTLWLAGVKFVLWSDWTILQTDGL